MTTFRILPGALYLFLELTLSLGGYVPLLFFGLVTMLFLIVWA